MYYKWHIRLEIEIVTLMQHKHDSVCTCMSSLYCVAPHTRSAFSILIVRTEPE